MYDNQKLYVMVGLDKAGHRTYREIREEEYPRIKVGIEGADNELFSSALALREFQGDVRYYPVPLVFGSLEERDDYQIVTGEWVPTTRWILRRRKAIAKMVGAIDPHATIEE